MSSITIKVPNWLDKICAWPVVVYRQLKFGYPFRKIPLGEGRFTLVDPALFYQLNIFQWYADGKSEKIYAVRNIISANENSRTMRLHREIMNVPPGILVDHRNGNTLDNRRTNLRLATCSQNSCNRQKTKSKTSSRFIGVSFDKHKVVWTAYISFHRKRIWLGCFKTEIEAAKAHDEAAKKHHGEFARLNFPENSQSPSK
jgi:hypothetical protein